MPLIGVDVKFGTPLHDRIIRECRARWQLCHDKSSSRFEKWRKAEDQFMIYMKLSEADRIRKSNRDNGQPSYVTLEIPYSYSQLLAAHTYDCAVFLGRSPIHQYSGRHAQTEDSTQALEALIDYQVQAGKMLVPYYVWLMDRRKYGCGIIGMKWEEETSTVVNIVEQQPMWAGFANPFAKPKKIKQVNKIRGYHGNKIFNIRPYDFIFDPRVTLANFQEGEFAGYYSEVTWNYVYKRAESKEFQNVDALKNTLPGNWWREKGSSQLETPNRDRDSEAARRAGDDNLGYVEFCNLVVELVPANWGLGSSNSPEKWFFVIGNDKVVLLARPLGLIHDQYPFDIAENEVEGYGLFKRSMLEILQPYNDTLSWLINTHFYNIRKTLNDQLVFDPSRITVKDLTEGDGGRLIRLKPEAYGTDWRTAIGQLQVFDVTQTHLQDTRVIMELAQRMVGVNDNAMGLLNSGGRKTATEVRQSNTGAIGRLKTEAEYLSAQGFAPHSMKLVQQSQQFFDGEMQLSIAGNLMQRAGKLATAMVTPDAIMGQWDFVPVDGTMPIDRFAQAAIWKDIMTQMASMPSLMMQYDLGSIFAYVAQLAGIKNVESFKLQFSPEDQLQRQVQMGNVLPLGGGGGRKPGKSGRPATGADGTPQGPAPVTPVAGVGPVG